jgi:fused signal recognition particle receptor
VDDETLDHLERILYEADLGGECAQDFIKHLKSELRTRSQHDLPAIVNILKSRAESILSQTHTEPKTWARPEIILIVGVNGSGKT